MKERKKPSRSDAIYQIALAGISAAIALLFVWLSVIVRYSTVAFYIAASLAIMVPMTKKYYIASVFAYIASAALGFVIAGDITVVVGYVAYFGPMALISGICFNLRVRIYISLPIKIVYINGALALMYFVCHTIMINAEIIGQIHYAIIAVVGTIILVAIDFALQFVYSRVAVIMQKVLRTKSSEQTSPPPEEEVSPFEELDDDKFVFDLNDDKDDIFAFDFENDKSGKPALDINREENNEGKED